MPTAEIITIGTELLLGEILDTNAKWIARQFRDHGIDLYRLTTIGDNPDRIADAIRKALGSSDIVVTTGGLGPTVDDPTREAVAKALDRELEFVPELWVQIQERFKQFGRPAYENNRRQAYIPHGAEVIPNPVGTAPSFRVIVGDKVVISLPGVPREMEYLMTASELPWLCQFFRLAETIKARILHTVGIGESQIDELIGDLEKLSNPTVGLAAHSGQVDVRITAKADSLSKAKEAITAVETEIRKRLGNWIYGADEETLEEASLDALKQRGWTLVILERGLSGSLINRLARVNPPVREELRGVFLGGEVRSGQVGISQLASEAAKYRQEHNADVCLGAGLLLQDDQPVIQFVLITPTGESRHTRQYGGHPEYTSRFALHSGLDLLRNLEFAE